MNHLPLLLAVIFVIAAGIFLFTGDGDDEEAPVTPSPPPDDEPEELEPPPEALRPDGTKVDLSIRLERVLARDVTVAAALQDVGRSLDARVEFTDAAWKRVEAARVGLELQDVGVPTVLNLLTEPYGVVYRVHHGVLWILMPGEEPTETVR